MFCMFIYWRVRNNVGDVCSCNVEHLRIFGNIEVLVKYLEKVCQISKYRTDATNTGVYKEYVDFCGE